MEREMSIREFQIQFLAGVFDSSNSLMDFLNARYKGER